MNPFITAFLIVSGILSPFILIALCIYLFNEVHIFVVSKRIALEIELENAKKKAPYDHVEFSQPPNTRMFTVRLLKNNEVVYEGSHDKELQND